VCSAQGRRLYDALKSARDYKKDNAKYEMVRAQYNEEQMQFAKEQEVFFASGSKRLAAQQAATQAQTEFSDMKSSLRADAEQKRTAKAAQLQIDAAPVLAKKHKNSATFLASQSQSQDA
jgi:hypothetical protein